MNISPIHVVKFWELYDWKNRCSDNNPTSQICYSDLPTVFTSENLGKKSWEKGNKFLVKRSHLGPVEFFPGEALKERNDTLILKVVETLLHVYWMGTTQAQL